MPLETGLVGRDDLVSLVELLIERRARQPLPIVVAFGPGGSGKTELLHHLRGRHRPAAPVAYVDLDRTGTGSVKAILDVAYGRLHGYFNKGFGRLPLPRYTLARAALAALPPAGERSDQRARSLIGSQVRGLSRFTEIVSDSGEAAPAGAAVTRLLTRLLAPLLRWLIVLAVMTPTPLRRLIGTSGAVLQWYERVGGPIFELPAGCRADAVVHELWELAASAEVADREKLDRLLVRAFLADIKAAYRWQRHRKVNTLFLLDNADLLPGAESRRFTGSGGADFLALLAETMAADPEVPFFVVAAKQATPDQPDVLEAPGPEDASQAAQPAEEELLTEAEKHYSRWRRDHDPANHDSIYLAAKLRPFTLAQTRQLLARRNAFESKTVETRATVEHLQEVTHGHPLAVWALYRRDRFRPALRDIYDEGVDWGEGVSPRWTRTWRGLLLWRFLHRLDDVEPFETLPGTPREQDTDRSIARRDYLARLAAARELDVATVRVLAGVSESEARRRLRIIATFSFADRVPGGGLRLHPLLRDLLVPVLGRQTEPDGDPSYLAVHDRLRAHFAGRPGREADHLYHCLAIGDTHTVAEQLRQRIDAGDETWLSDLLQATQAPALDKSRRRWRDWIEARVSRRTFDRFANPDLVRIEELVQALWVLRSCTSLVPQHHGLYDKAIGALDAVVETGLAERQGTVDELLVEYQRRRQALLDDAAAEPSPDLSQFARPVPSRPYPHVWPPRHFFRRLAALMSFVLVLGYAAIYLSYPVVYCNRPSVFDPAGVVGDVLDPGLGLRNLDGQCIGVSDRPGAFTANRPLNPDDREVVELAGLVAAENERVADFVKADHDFTYVTVVVATMLSSKETSGGDQAAGINELRGAYLAQKQWNLLDTKSNPPPVLLRIVLANFGGNSDEAKGVALQIRELADRDPTVVAVSGMGQTREDTVNAAKSLGEPDHGVAMVGSVPSGGDFTGLLYFVRIAPPNEYQAKMMYEFMRARPELNRPTRYLFVDNDDQYSKELANEFQEHDPDADRLSYNSSSRDTTTSLRRLVDAVCVKDGQDQPASPLIVYTGRTSEFSSLLKALRGASDCRDVRVLGADDLSQLETENFQQLQGDEEFADGKVYFTTFGPSRLGWRGMFRAGIPGNVESFFDAYDQLRRAPDVAGKAYRSDTNGHIMAAYDAIGLIMRGVGDQQPKNREEAFRKIRAATPYSGVSGRVVFRPPPRGEPDTGADPVDKLIVLQRVVDRDGTLSSEYVESKGYP
ncbi:hypothetical protein [Flindersiella endophytica]